LKEEEKRLAMETTSNSKSE